MPYLPADIGNAEGEPVVPERQIRITEKPGVPDGEFLTEHWNKYLCVKISGKPGKAHRKQRDVFLPRLTSPKAGNSEDSCQAFLLVSCVPQQ